VQKDQIPDFLLFLLFEITVNEIDATLPVFQITKEEIEEFQYRVKWATLSLLLKEKTNSIKQLNEPSK